MADHTASQAAQPQTALQPAAAPVSQPQAQPQTATPAQAPAAPQPAPEQVTQVSGPATQAPAAAGPLASLSLPAQSQAAPAQTTAPAAKPALGRGLGRGLGALLDDSAAAAIAPAPLNAASGSAPAVAAEKMLPLDNLQPSSVQPRRFFDEDALKALSGSIKSQGLLQPLLVRPVKGQPDQYEIIGGERRWRAARMAGLSEVPVIIRQLDDGRALEVALVENIQRADLNPLEEATGYQRLVNEFHYTHEDMARVTGKSRSHITNLLRLLALPDNIKQCVTEGQLTMGHARALLSLADDPELQARAANKVIKNQLSVRETEDLVRNLVRPNQPARGRRPADPKISALEQLMQERVGLKVAIRQKDTQSGGSVRIFFDNLDELSTLLKRLTAERLAAQAGLTTGGNGQQSGQQAGSGPVALLPGSRIDL